MRKLVPSASFALTEAPQRFSAIADKIKMANEV